MIGTALDVTEVKLAEKELSLKATELESRNSDLKNYAYVASHDLQEPLRKLTVFCSLLQTNYKNKLDEKANEYINKITSSALRMRSLISNILEVSSVCNNQKYTTVDLDEVVNNVLADLETSIESSKAKIILDKLSLIEPNATQMYQVLQNLISNAIKFSKPDQSPIVEITSVISGTGKEKQDIIGLNKGIESHLQVNLNCIITIKDNDTGFEEINR
ncbi:MAG TPA: histidine kinase dimerization/phospho-acceptor domain-containing protein, partial [Flavisolibacter sp.]|nr:histidine kinase dimerization/phospho-acceptor domain-containing protein [Flavisolibacter sp.]